jgi:hypothetical protein
MRSTAFAFFVYAGFTLATLPGAAQGPVVINEIHYNPDVKSELVEFIELHNAGAEPVNLSGWAFTSGISFTFPPGSTIAPDGYAVVTENTNHFRQKFGFTPFGPYSGKLDNQGERIVLRNAAGRIEDEVTYKLGFPWPTVGGAPGHSIELVHPSLDNDLGGSWRASGEPLGPVQGTPLINSASTWRYFKGTSEASSPTTLWRQITFNDANWLSGRAPIGYDPSLPLGTILSDMNGGYTSVFLRHRFTVTNVAEVTSLILEAVYDDGFKAWINGVNVLNANMSASEVPFNGVAGPAREDNSFNSFNLSNPQSYLVSGENVLAIQLHNSSLSGSSDAFIDARLIARTGGPGSGPSPGRRNNRYAENNPPQIRQVKHLPNEPRANETVTISAKITDPQGVAGVTLLYQVVDPGNYIELTDTAYTNNWVAVPMNDAGTGGDAVAGDDVYTAQLPASLQVHRRLIRYRIEAGDGAGLSVQVPYNDDPQPNFGYFVYNGIPDWRGSIRPGVAPVMTVPASEMGRLPAYHLISKKSTVENGTWFSRYQGDQYLWQGTLVYDGTVYDHIRFRARGGVWRYAMAKNMWKFRLNRGHEFQARDNWGRKYPTTWNRLNLGASIQQGNFNHRGEQGMFESVGFRLFNMAGVESPHTTFITFRVIDEALEAHPTDQFEGDFWGVYLVVEQEDGRFLDAHDLPEGNLYKMENGTGPAGAAGELKHLGWNQVDDYSDLISFRNTYLNTNPTDQWWRDNLDLFRYFSYQTMVQGIHHYDICCGKNYYYFRNPDTGKWQVHTWDLDLTWADNMYVAGVAGGTEPFRSPVLSNFSTTPARPALMLEFKNRVREIRDLLFNTNETWRLLDEYAGLLRGPSTGPTILDADRAMWDYNPKMVSSTYSTHPADKAGHGRFYQMGTPTKDFAGMVQLMKNYVAYRSSSAALSPAGNGLDALARDTAIPSTPVASYTGPAGYPLNRLSFRASNYTGSNPFAARKWRIAAVTPPGSPAFNTARPNKYEIEAIWESAEITDLNQLDVTIPSHAVRAGETYRVRVKTRDTTGRWSHWSAPVEFVSGEPEAAAQLLAHLRLTELMYHSPGGSDFDFVELFNSSTTDALDLNGAKFTQGIDYTFGPGTIIPPEKYLLVVKASSENNFAAFRQFYGLSGDVLIFGPYGGNFSNDGEEVRLRTSAGGTDIIDFEYRTGRGWPLAAAGAGHSLVPLDRAADGQPNGSLSYGGNWRASTFIKGSPGARDPEPADPIVLNEIVAHTDFMSEEDSNDWIELFNRSNEPFIFGPGWYLSDRAANLTKWMIPAGTEIPARGWITFDEVTGFNNPPGSGFALSKSGEQVFLSYLPGANEDRVVDSVSFKGQENDWSLGRYPDGNSFWHGLTPRTDAAANSAPLPGVVISELMYHPPATTEGEDNTAHEFIELFNASAAPVSLIDTNSGWRIAGGVSFTFPENSVIGAGESILVVSFDPADAALLSGFRAAYGLSTPGPRIYGPYSGRLSNKGERVALEKPQRPDRPGDPISWVIADEVFYFDSTPWQAGADGFGASLQRLNMAGHGSDPENWTAATPTPGAGFAGGNPPLITDHPSPQNQTSRAGEEVVYSVAATGAEPFSYQWLFNGKNISGATGRELRLTNVQPENSGAYSVLVLNPAGSALSDVARLYVTTPPQISVHPLSQNVRPGTNVTLSVVAFGVDPLVYQWRVDGAPIPGATNATLLFTDIQVEQEGTYTVSISDINGTIVSEPAVLLVLVPAYFIEHPRSQTVVEGSTVTFRVVAGGTKPIAYRWRKGGSSYVGFDQGRDTLTIENVRMSDAANYTVVITNIASTGAGVLSQTATLTVLADSDGDGMPDTWEIAHGFNPNDPSDAALDADGDGLTNLQEYLAGTDPRDPESYLKIESIVADFASEGTVTLGFTGRTNTSYTILFKDSLGGGFWQSLADVPAALTNRPVEVVDQPSPNTPKRFYRLVTPTQTAVSP